MTHVNHRPQNCMDRIYVNRISHNIMLTKATARFASLSLSLSFFSVCQRRTLLSCSSQWDLGRSEQKNTASAPVVSQWEKSGLRDCWLIAYSAPWTRFTPARKTWMEKFNFPASHDFIHNTTRRISLAALSPGATQDTEQTMPACR